MRKLWLLTLLAVAGTGAAHAQQGTLRYGVKGGFSLGTYAGQLNGRYEAGYKPGYTVGALMAYSLTDHASLQLEALYSRKGVFVDSYAYQLPSGRISSAYRYRSTLSYLDVPLLVKLQAGAANTGFFLEAGPQLSIALAQREYVAPFGSNASNFPNYDISTDRGALVPVGYGFVGGLGYQFGFGLGLGFRYTADFSHVYQDESGPGSSGVSTTNNFHNSVLQVQAHYLLGSRK